MAILKPLYYAGGEYTATDDRKILASLVGSQADGTRVVGVIGSPNFLTGCMKVTAGAGLSVTVQPGLCVIADSILQDKDEPSLYLAGVDTSEYTLSLSGPASGDRTDLIYAKFDDTPYHVTTASRSGTTVTLTTNTLHGFSVGDTLSVSGLGDVFDGDYVATIGTGSTTITYETVTSGTIATTYFYATATLRDTQDTAAGSATPITIINRSFALDSNSSIGTATITTESAHGLLVGDTVKISGVGAFFDGIYTTYTGTSGSTITYRKSGNNISTLGSSGAIQNFFAVVRAPFTIKQAQNTTELPSVIGIPLAEIVVTSGSVTSVIDKRTFASANGGVQLYDSTTGSVPDHAKGKLAYDATENKLYYSDGTTFNEITISTHSHSSQNRYRNAVYSSSGVLAMPVSDAAETTFTTINNANGYFAGALALNPDISVDFTAHERCYVMVHSSIYISSSTAGDILRVGLDLGSPTNLQYNTYSGTGQDNSADGAGNGSSQSEGDYIEYYTDALSTAGTVQVSNIYVLQAGTTTIKIKAELMGDTSDTFTISAASLRVIPLFTP